MVSSGLVTLKAHIAPVRWLLFASFYAVFANIPYWATSQWFGVRCIGLFCIEYCAIGVLALFVPRTCASVLLFAMTGIDIVAGVTETFNLSFMQCVANLGVVSEFSWRRLAEAFAVIFLVLLFCAISLFLPRETTNRRSRVRVLLCLVVFASISLSFDGAAAFRREGFAASSIYRGFHNAGDSISLSYFEEIHPSRTPTIRLLRAEVGNARVRKAEIALRGSGPDAPSAAALAVTSAGIMAGGKRPYLPNLVLVVVESWGLSIDSSIGDRLVAPYFQRDLVTRYRVSQGTIPFFGSTVPAEGRELCGSHIGFNLTVASALELHDCLPDRLAALGYHSISMHGMDGRLFNRNTWYKRIGFQQEWFKDQFEKEGLPDCLGALIGTCDSDIAGWIGDRLDQNTSAPDFVYWVTLNSHLPVLVPSPLSGGEACGSMLSLSGEPALCSWYQLIANVHRSVSRVAMTNLARPTIFVIVGDHAPPFRDLGLRSRFSSTVVPYVILLPRSSGARGVDPDTSGLSGARWGSATRPSSKEHAPLPGTPTAKL